MPDKKINYVWLVDAEGTRARVESAADADYWKPFGWADSVEPATADECFVWLQHEITGGKARFACSAAPQWAGLGWHPSAPPEPIDLTHDPELVDVKEEPAASSAKSKTTANKEEQANA